MRNDGDSGIAGELTVSVPYITAGWSEQRYTKVSFKLSAKNWKKVLVLNTGE
jgi:hypothetical protein